MRRSVCLLFRGVVRHAFFQMREKLVFDFAGGGGGRGGEREDEEGEAESNGEVDKGGGWTHLTREQTGYLIPW